MPKISRTQVRTFLKNALIWDAHACFPLEPDADLSDLYRYKASGYDFVSINVGMDMESVAEIIQVLAGFRRTIRRMEADFTIVRTVAEIKQAKRRAKLALAFDLEGSEPLDGNLAMISLYYDLGVRQMLLAYNLDNRASGGCEGDGIGLTDYGCDVIEEMNRVGMIVDLSHMSRQATLEAAKCSSAPVIFSHSNPARLKQHNRNIDDDQIRACAITGGVVGINGVGAFLGGTVSEIVADNICYVADLVGVEHVGLGLDYVVDQQGLIDYILSHPEAFPEEEINAESVAFVVPEQIEEITLLLLERGLSMDDVLSVLGGNFMRVATSVW